MSTITCPHCHRHVSRPDVIHWDGLCACGRSVFEALQGDEQTLYTTTRDYATQVVRTALGDHQDGYDVEGIAAAMLARHNAIDPRTGLIDDNRSGFVERRDVSFWEVAAAHEKGAPDAGTSRAPAEIPSKSSIAQDYLARSTAETPAGLITEPVATSGGGLHISVFHDQEDGFTVAHIAMSDAPESGRDFTLPELWSLIDDLTTAAGVLAEVSPVPYAVVD